MVTIPLAGEFNNFLERNNFKLNDAGGKTKISADGMLLQSATIAEMVPAEFADGINHLIPVLMWSLLKESH